MGYQQGQRIGKAGTGLAEPLPLLLKQASLRGWRRVLGVHLQPGGCGYPDSAEPVSTLKNGCRRWPQQRFY